MKIKEIMNLTSEDLENKMTSKEFDKMKELGFDETWKLLDVLKDGARESGLSDDDEYITISAYLDYLEDMRA